MQLSSPLRDFGFVDYVLLYFANIASLGEMKLMSTLMQKCFFQLCLVAFTQYAVENRLENLSKMILRS